MFFPFRYADGKDFEHGSALSLLLIGLLKSNLTVAIVTAAGYGEIPSMYEGRLSGLLHGIKSSDLTDKQKSSFLVMGGECNFL